MPIVPPSTLRKQLSQAKPDPVYLIVGDDEAEMAKLAAEINALVEDELRAFNAERFYAGEKGVTPSAVVEAARILPMMSDRRVVTVMRAEKMLKPRRRGKGAQAEAEDDADAEAPTELDVLEAYVRNPVPQTTLVMVAARRRSHAQAVQDAPEAGHDRRMLGAEGQPRRRASISGKWRGPRSSWSARPWPVRGSRSILRRRG